jgi:hypothetical protein
MHETDKSLPQLQRPSALRPCAAAEYIGISVGTLNNKRIYGGGPPFIKVGRVILYPTDALDAWLAEQPRYRSTSEYEAAP